MPALRHVRVFPCESSRARARAACALSGFAFACALTSSCQSSRDAVDPRVNVSRISVELAFDRATPGDMPSGVSALSGEWKIAADDSAPSPRNAFVMTTAAAKQPYNLALLDDVKLAGVEASVKFRAIAGEIEQGGGLVWRAKDAQNYYLARWNPLANNVRLFKVLDGEPIQLASETVHAGAGWHELKIQAKGEQLRVWLDGHSRLSAKDGSFREAGKVGLWTKADAQTAFDDLKVAATK
jgi:hypothetical protein